MPSRKQRRRREKSFRHEYGFVTYDEEGNEVEVDPAEVRPAKPKSERAQAKPTGKGGRALREPAKQAARTELDTLRAGLDLHGALDDDDPGVLLDLMLAERLSRFERDQNRARPFVLMDDVGIARASRRVDRAQVPVLHGGDLDTGRSLDSPAWSSPSTASCSTRATRRTAG